MPCLVVGSVSGQGLPSESGCALQIETSRSRLALDEQVRCCDRLIGPWKQFSKAATCNQMMPICNSVWLINECSKFGKAHAMSAFVCFLNLASQMRGRQNGQAHCSHGNFNAARSTLPKGQVRYLTLVPWEIRTPTQLWNLWHKRCRTAEPPWHLQRKTPRDTPLGGCCSPFRQDVLLIGFDDV